MDPTALMEAADSQPSTAAPATSDAALIAELETKLVVPTYMVDQYRQMQADRDYVRRDCMLMDTQDAVAVNLVLRNQYIGLSFLGVSAPEPEVQAARAVGGLIAPPVEQFAETLECHLSRQSHLMRFGEKLEGACQDGYTQGIAWLKVTLQSDYMRDPIGRARFNDQQPVVMEYLALQAKQRAGNILPESRDAMRMVDLEKTLRIFLAGAMEERIKSAPLMTTELRPAVDMAGIPIIDPATGQPQMELVSVPDPTDPRELSRKALIDGVGEVDILGVPEIEHYLGFACDEVLPEDMRIDWTITRPEDATEAAWIGHRVFMNPRDIYTKFQVNRDKLAGATLYDDKGCMLETKYGGGNDEQIDTIDPNYRQDLNAQMINGRIAVWEVWHRAHCRRYVFVAGTKHFLINEVPQAVGSRFYPFFPLVFNRVTGQMQGPSDVMLQRPSQDEYNTLRSHQREARRASYPVLFVPKDWLGKEGQELYRKRMPFSVLEVDNPDEVKSHIHESATMPYNPEAFNTAECRMDLQTMAGIPAASTGGDSNDTATASALAKEGMEHGVTRRRTTVNRLVSDIYEWMAEISVKVWPESYMLKCYGPMAVFPRLTAEEMYSQLTVSAKGGLSGKPRAKDNIDLMLNFATICQALQLPVNGTEVLKDLLDAMGIRKDYRKYIMAPQLPLPGMGFAAPAGGPGMPPGGPGLPPQRPEAQGPQGAAGGAPPLAERGAPNQIQQVPNHPPRQTPNAPSNPFGS